MNTKRKLYINSNDYIEVDEGKRPLTEEIATRRRNFDFFSSGTYLTNPDKVLRKLGKDIDTYDEIKGDSHVKSCIRSRKSGVTSMLWEIDRGKSKSKYNKIITKIFSKLKIRKIISNFLEAPQYGYKPLEIIWGFRDVDGREYVVPINIKGKSQKYFVFDEDNNLLYRSKENFNGELLPDKKFLLPRQEDDDDNPYGFADLSLCFWWYTFKKGGIKFWLKFIEKYGMPFAVGKTPRGTKTSEIDDLMEKLDAMIQNAVAVIPDDASISILEASGKGVSSQLYKDFETFCNQEISKAILGQTLTTETTEGNGSNALGKVHMDVRKDIVDADARLVEDTFNQLIAWIIELNYGEVDDIPSFILYNEEDIDTDLANRDKTLIDSGNIRFTQKHFIQEYGFELDEFEMVRKITPAPSLPQNFAEQKPSQAVIDPTAKPQDTIEKFAEFFSDEDLGEQIENTLKPVIRTVMEGANYNECMEKLVTIYPDMGTNELEDTLSKAMFIADTFGRITGRNE